MRHALVRLFAFALRLFPAGFRLSYAPEMERVFADRVKGLSTPALFVATATEVADVLLSAARAHASAIAVSPHAAARGLAVALLVAIAGVGDIARRYHARSATAAGRIEFSARDPAGNFSLTILEGRPVSASIDNVPLPRERLVHSGDSIRFLTASGKVALAIAYYRETGRIEWQARPRACRDPAAGCGG